MAPIPTAWQSVLGAQDLTGNGALSILSRTSSGPALFGFNPGSFSSSSPTTPTPYTYYPIDDPLGAMNTNNPLFDGNTTLNGVVFVPGSSSVLVFGSVGTNSVIYGTNSQANDPYHGSKGFHSVNGDYAYQVWAYNANDFLSVMDGQMQPWQVQPYATWNFDFPQYQGAKSLGGVAFDPSTDRLYVEEQGADTQAPGSYLPVIQVYQLTLSSAPAGTNSVSLQSATASPSVTSASVSDVGANLNTSIAPLAAIQSNPSAGSEINAASSSSSSISISKRLPAHKSVTPRTDTIVGLAIRRSRVSQSGNKHSLASQEKFGLESDG